MTTLVYALLDPRTSLVRYVGKTGKTLKARLGEHIHKAKESGEVSHRGNWIRSLLKAGLRPEIRLIEECSGDGSPEEIYHIALARSDGLDLTNATPGGECGALGWRPSPEQRARISERCRRYRATPETKARMSAAQLGKRHSDDAKEKMRRFRLGKKLSPESIEKRSAKLRGKPLGPGSYAAVLKNAAARKGKPAHPAVLASLRAQGQKRQGKPPHPTVLANLLSLAERRRGKPLPPDVRAKIGKANRSLDDSAEEALARDYIANVTMEILIERYSVSMFTIYKILNRRNVPKRGWSAQTREKLRQGRAGRKASDETRAKMSEAAKHRRRARDL